MTMDSIHTDDGTRHSTMRRLALLIWFGGFTAGSVYEVSLDNRSTVAVANEKGQVQVSTPSGWHMVSITPAKAPLRLDLPGRIKERMRIGG